jgi:hypothetical protein
MSCPEVTMSLDHDGIFKQLLSAFLVEFLDLFVPDLLALLDTQDLTFLPTESFVNLLDPDRRTADLLVDARIRGSPSAILIHLEHQAQADDQLDRRMFRYFARFYDCYDRLVYPIALCSYPSPRRHAAHRHQLGLGRRTILTFEYQVVQLNQFAWRDYLGHPNPLAAALMTRMHIARPERWQVKAAALKQVLGLTLNANQRRMLVAFISVYLPLNPHETAEFEATVATWHPHTKESVMELISEWEQKGIEKGRLTERRDLVLRQLERRCGPLSAPIAYAITALSPERLLALSEALLDFANPEELQAWLANQR